MKVFIDILTITGVIASTAGVFLEFGLGYSLIFGGLAVAGLALNTARSFDAAHTDEG